MKKLYLILLALVLVPCAANADGIWWGYFSESDAQASNYDGLGTGAMENFEAAIYVPANHPVLGTATISAVRVWLGNYISSVSSFKVWISTELTNNAEGAAVVQTVPVSELTNGANAIKLDQPFAVNNQGFYVGYTIGLKSAVYPIMQGGEWVENSFFLRSSQNVTDWGAIDYFGKLALQVYADGVQLAKNAAVAADFGTAYVTIGEQATIPVTVTNMGSEPIKTLSFTITSNGQTSDERTISKWSLPFNSSQTFNVYLDSDNQPRRFAKTLTITKVNGQPNEAANPTAEGSLITILEKPEVTPVVEEFTGTWCGWCPVGFDGMERAHETFGDRVILIAAHNGDPMAIADYNPIMATVSGFPSSYVNRNGEDVYPSANNLKNAIDAAMNRTTVAKFDELYAQWNNEEGTEIEVTPYYHFVYSDDQPDYALAIVLTEDGLTGTTSKWAQANYLSGRDGYQSLAFWYNAGSSVTGLEFNHVAVAAWEIERGFEGSVPPAFSAGDILFNKFYLSISGKSVIQNKSNLHVIALLIDRSTGQIVNAAQTYIQPFHSGSVGTVDADPSDAVLYDLSGRAVPAGQLVTRGIYIRNGRKVVVR